MEERSEEIISREKAKAELEKRIAEKLSRMSETDLDALFQLHEQQMVVKKSREKSHSSRRSASLEGQISFVDMHKKEGLEEEILPARKGRLGRAILSAFLSGFEKFASGRTLIVCGRGVKNVLVKIIILSLFIFRGICGAVKAAAGKIYKISKRAFSFICSPFKKLAARPEKLKAAGLALIKFKMRLVSIENKLSGFMARLITRLDKRNEVLAKRAVIAVVRSNRRVYFVRELADIHKRKLLAGLLVVLIAAITSVSVTNYFSAYVYAYNGRPLGMVKNQEDVLRVLEVVSEQLTREYGTEIEIDKDNDITFERVVAINPEIDDMQEVFNRLTYMQDMNAKAYVLYIDKRRMGILDSEERVFEMLEDFKAIYRPMETGVKYLSSDFAEEIEIRPIDTQLGRIQNPKDILDVMLSGSMAEKIHYVEQGETFSGIAKKYNMTMAELESMNPGITPARLSIGQEIVLVQAVPFLTVQTVEEATYQDIIPYDIIYEDSASLFKGEQSTRIKGTNGERQVTARITRNNGYEVAREELVSKTIKEPSPATVVRGTKDPPPLQGTGTFKYPVSGYRLTSSFGMRSGRMHYGIDMACKSGTWIRAADGGTVVFAGYRASFGYVVEIDHGGNIKTLYAHCSAIHVKRGDKVFQHQHIANVGSTGRSTGPHLHFEVHKNGVPQNPISYLSR